MSEDERDLEQQQQDLDDEDGQSIEALAEGEDGEPEEEEEPQISLFGTDDKLTASVKGRRPTESMVKIKSRQERIGGQYGPDETFEVVTRVRVDRVSFDYIRDSDGDVLAVKRIHHLTPLHVDNLEVRVLDLLERAGISQEDARAIVERGLGRTLSAVA